MIVAVLGMLVLILDGKTAVMGASQGVMLCIRQVIPSLFPFFLLSGAVIRGLKGGGSVLGIPGSIWICGFLGGYPMGARSIGQACSAGALSREQGERLLGCCCNAGPAFFFGMLPALFPEGWMVWTLWAIHVAGALLVWALSPGEKIRMSPLPDASGGMQEAVKAMGTVCGWVIFFRVWIAFLSRWAFWAIPLPVQAAVTGAIELVNGCSALGYIGDVGLRFILCSGMIGFGGICVAMQTKSVIGGLSMGPYLRGKLMQTGFSILLAWGVVHRIWGIPGACFLLFLGLKCSFCSRKTGAVGV